MATKCKIFPSKLENLPIIDDHCCVNLATSKIDNSTINRERSKNSSERRSLVKRCKLIYVAQIMLAISILCLAAFMVYSTVASDCLHRTDRTKIDDQEQSSMNKSFFQKEAMEPNVPDLQRYFYGDRLRDTSPEVRSIFLQIDRDRLKRHAETNPCEQNMEHCKTVIDSMWSIVRIVNDSMPHLQAFLRNLTLDNSSSSNFRELVKCLQCKNESTRFVDRSDPVNVTKDDRTEYDHLDHAQIKNNVVVVTSLLNEDDKKSDRNDRNDRNEDSTFSSIKPTDHEVHRSEQNTGRSTSSILDDRQTKDSIGTTQEAETWSTIESMEYESTSIEAEAINSTTGASMTPKREETTTRASRIDDTTRTTVTTVTLNVTEKADDATEVANDTVHPSVHPSGQGHGERNQSTREASKGSRKSDLNQELQGRIVFNDRYQPKVSLESAPGMMPTAETMKSTQQLQLSPTMTWMPYQVCFYGPQANAQAKQAGPGQSIYPASSPGAAYPISMPQQRPGVHNPSPVNQPSNYVQVQAQSVQFMPMQSYPGHLGRVGPTGPASVPMFPGYQTSPSGGANPSVRSPYYCTYIPAPTFQFPAIPGVSEYQRTAVSSGDNDETRNATKEERDKYGGRSFVPEYRGQCPFHTIRCGDGKRCILRSQWCDGQVDCNDASDETMCSCRDRISQERLCDGYFDCPHGEDELGCLGCPKTSFSCNDWRKRYTTENCVPLSQRCDGIKQCANGKDEVDCNILTPTYIEGKNVFTIGYTEGYLHKNFRGQWYPVCTAIDAWANDACVSEIGSESNEMPSVKIHAVPDKAYQGPYLAEVGGQLKLVPSCMNTAVYVRCPKFRCGTRVLSNQNPLRPYTLEKEDRNALQSPNDNLQPFYGDTSDWRTNDESNKEDDMVGSQLRVVGGRASQPEAWPFLVAIYKDGNFYCGGVILNEQWILTAAHCLDGYMGHYYEIQAGMLRRFSFSPMAQFKKARYTVVHPQYSSQDMKNDIAMIMLDEPLRFNRWVRPVCLPEADTLGAMWRNKPEPNSTCVAIGWGATREHGPDPDHLREVEVPILKDCKYEIDQNEAAICAGYPQGGRDACQGDSGGPLMCRNPYSESQWYVAGIVSHGEGCGRPDEPGTYTKVSYFLEWIQEISNDRGMHPLKRTPLERCPGFSCKGGLGKCLPIEARCNRIVDCLDGEDELNCYGNLNYPSYRKLSDSDTDFEFISSMENEVDNSMKSGKLSIYEILNVTDQPSTKKESINKIESTDTDNSPASSTISPMVSSMVSSGDLVTDRTEIDSSTAPKIIFTCTRLLQNIRIEKRCDRTVDCEDGTDEMDCTCKDFLRNSKPAAICDGYVDCDDQTDEQNCEEICSKDEFFCKTSKACIPLSKKCDGQFDCKFKEDELDCFTLSDGQHVYLDADKRPILNMQGILTRYVKNKWQPTCHRPRMHKNQSTLTLIGQNMCEYFGFAGFRSSDSIIVKNIELETISWNKENPTKREDPSAASLNDVDETCSGLYIRCTPVLKSSVSIHLTIDPETGSHVYLWPWLAAIFVDGGYRCSALLLDRSWLLSASKCVENVRLDENYTAAVLGYGPLFRHVDGPHRQVSIIDEVQPVNNSASVLLHLKHPVYISRHVQPLFLDRKIYLPGANDTCVAVGTNENYETESIFLRPVLQNCQSCQRCFVNTSMSQCSENQTSDWSGTVFCRGKKGWYPAATFQDHEGPCSFRDPQTLTSIDHINPYLTEAMDGDRQSIEATCDGFRCSIGQCVPKNRVCDGVPDCRDQSDEDPKYCEKLQDECEINRKSCHCKKSELRCGDGKCIDKSAFCDGQIDCVDGSDEPAMCTCAEYLKLTAPERLCDGVRHCFDKTDESPEMCPCRNNSLKCETVSGNDTCVPQDFICDGDRDCLDGKDEETCRMLRKLSNDGNESGEVIHRDYGVWHTECFWSPISSEEEASNLCKTMGYSSGNVINDTMIMDEPVVPVPDDFFIVKINDPTWLILRNDKPFVTFAKSKEACYRAILDCV